MPLLNNNKTLSFDRFLNLIILVILFSLSGSVVSAPIPNKFSKGETLDANLLNENFQAIPSGGNYIPNTTLERDALGWQVDPDFSVGSFSRVETTDGPASRFALQNNPNALTWGHSATWITIDRNNSYRATAAFNLLLLGSSGALYFAIRLRDANGVEIIGDGKWWYYPVNHLIPGAVGLWTQYTAEFGKGTTRPFPSNARYATVGFILNYDSSGVPGNNVYQVQGLGIYDTNNSQAVRWRNLTLLNSTTVYGAPYQAPQYRKIGEEVCLRGLVNNVTASGTVIASLKSGYIPPARLIFGTSGQATSGDRVDIVPVVDSIPPSGEIISVVVDSTSWLSLDGICYSTTP